MKDYLNKENGIILAIGAVAGIAITKLLKTDKARELTVKGLAKGIQTKDSITECLTNIKEEADDICNEAKSKAKKEAECGCGCDC